MIARDQAAAKRAVEVHVAMVAADAGTPTVAEISAAPPGRQLRYKRNERCFCALISRERMLVRCG